MFPAATGLFPKTSAYYADTSYPVLSTRHKAAELHEEYKQKYGKPLAVHASTFRRLRSSKRSASSRRSRQRPYGVDVTLNLTDQSTLIVSAVTGDFEATGFITFGDPNIDQIFFSNDTLKPVGEISLNFTRLRDDELTDDLHQARARPMSRQIRRRRGPRPRSESRRT